MKIVMNIVLVLQAISALVLIVVVLLQSGKSAGLSGTIAGGAETFFGKNKGKTIDAILHKWTAAFAALFLAANIAFSILSIKSAEADLKALESDLGEAALTDIMNAEPETPETPEAPEAQPAE